MSDQRLDISFDDDTYYDHVRCPSEKGVTISTVDGAPFLKADELVEICTLYVERHASEIDDDKVVDLWYALEEIL